ncbi:family 43 glycosylhydrolase [Sunxiuqinia sp. A32]|uniref:family 43 glycosylhydrolase n=1 Tax=Sunxiuqinia sp. A32 TaxID=3461496 RepID=UPI0040464AF0
MFIPKISVVFYAIIFLTVASGCQQKNNAKNDIMMYGDTSRRGVPFSKDPHVVKFNGEYLMYFSIPPYEGNNDPMNGWAIGIARSTNLIDWEKAGEIVPVEEYERKGLCAPGALVIDGKVHLFYQTYGNWRNDAICHAVSEDGIHFERNKTNPIFHPTGDWNCGRAIDAEVVQFNNQYLLYFATRDSSMSIQMQGVASAPINTNFNRDEWMQLTDEAILAPKYPWEGKCVEGASVVQKGDSLYMFYAGAYNNGPQQVGVAKSRDGINWERLSNKPFLENGDPGEWNSCESGHPHIYKDEDDRTYLFYQGNDDFGKTWKISQKEVLWDDKGPHLNN